MVAISLDDDVLLHCEEMAGLLGAKVNDIVDLDARRFDMEVPESLQHDFLLEKTRNRAKCRKGDVTNTRMELDELGQKGFHERVKRTAESSHRIRQPVERCRGHEPQRLLKEGNDCMAQMVS